MNREQREAYAALDRALDARPRIGIGRSDEVTLDYETALELRGLIYELADPAELKVENK